MFFHHIWFLAVLACLLNMLDCAFISWVFSFSASVDSRLDMAWLMFSLITPFTWSTSRITCETLSPPSYLRHAPQRSLA